MRHGAVSARFAPATVSRSELGILVDAEQRLDRLIEAGRTEARQVRAAAEQRAADVREELAIALAAACDDVAAAMQAETAEQIARVEADAQALAARYDQLRDGALDALVHAVERRLVAIATEEAP